MSVPEFRRRLLKWYDQARRNLPWRATSAIQPPTPYHILVSETMLQQTQVATVIPYYHRFLERFPTLSDLAAAAEQDVLRLWQGLGYYSRARNLQSAARMVVNEMDGHLPASRDELLKLPGVGRYTAGAVASIAFGQRAPILDGNVQRVLCRLDKITTDPRVRQTNELLWARAEQILPRKRVGDFNSALMELGATICTPRNPQCLLCPVRDHCEAQKAGLQEQIPLSRKTARVPRVRRNTYCINSKNYWLMEQRPKTGRWASMWQFITIEPTEANTAPALPVSTTSPRHIGSVSHALTHRKYEFSVFKCDATNNELPVDDRTRKWLTFKQLDQFPLPRPQLKIVQILRNLQG